jgi:hypothetical protein
MVALHFGERNGPPAAMARDAIVPVAPAFADIATFGLV